MDTTATATPASAIGNQPEGPLRAYLGAGAECLCTFPWPGAHIKALLYVQTGHHPAGPPWEQPDPKRVPTVRLLMDVPRPVPEDYQGCHAPHIERDEDGSERIVQRYRYERHEILVRRGVKEPGWRVFSRAEGFSAVDGEDQGELRRFLRVLSEVVASWPPRGARRRIPRLEIQEAEARGEMNPAALLGAFLASEIQEALRASMRGEA